MRPLAIDLFCGLGGWTEGLLAEGYDVTGFDIERHEYGDHKYPAQLVLQDVTTLHGSQFRSAALIVASPPCQAYSYRAMPWKRAKALPPPDNTLFEACFRLQREACAAAGRHIPLIVENVRGAQKWVGRARWNFGSFYLWGDVPALMPMTFKGSKVPGFRFDGNGGSFQTASVELSGVKNPGGGSFDRSRPSSWHESRSASGGGDWFAADAIKNGGGSWFNIAHNTTSGKGNNPDGRKQPGINLSEIGFNVANAHEFGHMVEGVKIKRSERDKHDHIGVKRKFASAMIAKIPLPLSRHIAATFHCSTMSVTQSQKSGESA